MSRQSKRKYETLVLKTCTYLIPPKGQPTYIAPLDSEYGRTQGLLGKWVRAPVSTKRPGADTCQQGFRVFLQALVTAPVLWFHVENEQITSNTRRVVLWYPTPYTLNLTYGKPTSRAPIDNTSKGEHTSGNRFCHHTYVRPRRLPYSCGQILSQSDAAFIHRQPSIRLGHRTFTCFLLYVSSGGTPFLD